MKRVLFLLLYAGAALSAQGGDPDPFWTRTVLLEDFSDPSLPSWTTDRKGGSFNVTGGALTLRAATLLGKPTTLRLGLVNLRLVNWAVEGKVLFRNRRGHLAWILKESSTGKYVFQFDAGRGQVRFEKWRRGERILAGIYGNFPFSVQTPYFVRAAVVDDFAFAQVSSDGWAWRTVLHYRDRKGLPGGAFALEARDGAELTLDDLRFRTLAAQVQAPLPQVVQRAWTDTFGDGDLLGWRTYPNGGLVALQNGALLLVSAASAQSATSAETANVYLRNFLLDLDVTTQRVFGQAGVDVRYRAGSAGKSFYRVVLEPSRNQVRLERHAGGTVTTLAAATYVLQDNRLYRLRVAALEGRLFVGLQGNGTKTFSYVLQVLDPAPLGGGALRLFALGGKGLTADNAVLHAVARFF